MKKSLTWTMKDHYKLLKRMCLAIAKKHDHKSVWMNCFVCVERAYNKYI